LTGVLLLLLLLLDLPLLWWPSLTLQRLGFVGTAAANPACPLLQGPRCLLLLLLAAVDHPAMLLWPALHVLLLLPLLLLHRCEIGA
jgi:hypothetical protein